MPGLVVTLLGQHVIGNMNDSGLLLLTLCAESDLASGQLTPQMVLNRDVLWPL